MNEATAHMMGSSPRMRGKLHVIDENSFVNRLIPAHAGKTGGPTIVASLAWAHPRACGENGYEPVNPASIDGSSPRMRGKLLPTTQEDYEAGLIPAHAGKTGVCVFGCGWFRAHPRACGENVVGEFEEVSSAGSSPRMRGKPAL